MNLVTYEELRPLLEVEHLSGDLLMEVMKLISESNHLIWVDYKDMETRATAYAIEQGWDPETTMVLYYPPSPVPTYKELEKEMGIEDPTDDFDIQIGSLNPSQIVCTLYPNMSATKFAETINRLSRMRVFL